MIQASKRDRTHITQMLCAAFDDNKSVNYLIPQGTARQRKLRRLMAYSFDKCMLYGEIYMNPDRTACALVLLPDLNRVTFKSIWLDLRLAVVTLGIRGTRLALQRDKAIQQFHPKSPLYHIWYIGVQPKEQGKGMGTRMLRHLTERARQLGRTTVLETSTYQNLPLYKRCGFTIYKELHFGFPLYCMSL